MNIQPNELLNPPVFEHLNWIEDIELRDIVQSFNQAYPVPEQAIHKAFERKNDIIPILLQLLKEVTDNPQNVGLERNDFLLAMFLLAAFKETRAFDYLIKMTAWDEDTAEELLGDIIYENFPGFLVATYDGNIDKIKNLIENETAWIYFRTGASAVLGGLVVEKILDRNDVMNYYRKLMRSTLVEHNEYFAESIMHDTCQLHPEEAREEILLLFDKNLVDSVLVSEEDLEEYFAKSLEECNDEIKKSKELWAKTTSNGIIQEIEWLYRDPKETVTPKNNDDDIPDHSFCGSKCLYYNTNVDSQEFAHTSLIKIGRNEKCHCGSEKKYKKCCLAKDEKENELKLKAYNTSISLYDF